MATDHRLDRRLADRQGAVLPADARRRAMPGSWIPGLHRCHRQLGLSRFSQHRLRVCTPWQGSSHARLYRGTACNERPRRRPRTREKGTEHSRKRESSFLAVSDFQRCCPTQTFKDARNVGIEVDDSSAREVALALRVLCHCACAEGRTSSLNSVQDPKGQPEGSCEGDQPLHWKPRISSSGE